MSGSIGAFEQRTLVEAKRWAEKALLAKRAWREMADLESMARMSPGNAS